MARLADLATIHRTVGLRTLAGRVWFEILDDHIFLFSGALAYAWLFAVFPFFIFMVNLIPYLPGDRPEKTVESVGMVLEVVLPHDSATAITEHMRDQIGKPADQRAQGWVLPLSLAFALWAASGGTTVTMAALDKCYEQRRPRIYYQRRPMAFGLTILVTTMVLGLLVLLPLGTLFRNWALSQFGYRPTWLLILFEVLRWSVAIAIAVWIIGIVYHFGPCVKRRWRCVTPGSLFAMSVWLISALAFKTYVDHFGSGRYTETYGAAGWVVVLLLFFYIDAIVLLVGAEINSEIDFEVLKVPRGSRNFRDAERHVHDGNAPSSPAAAPEAL